MSQQVDEILNQIQHLDESERLALEQRLQELGESDWKSEIEQARQLARQQGLDQATIDEAIHELRYGS